MHALLAIIFAATMPMPMPRPMPVVQPHPFVRVLPIVIAAGAFRSRDRGHSAPGVAARSWSNAYSTLFDGTNDYVDLGTNAALRPNLSNTEFTISLWFKTASLAALQYVAAHAEPFAGGGANMNWIIGVTTGGRLFGYFGAAAKTTESGSNGAVVINTWYHAAYTVRNISGTFTGNIWLNGAKQGSDVTSPGTDTTSSRSARIGAGYVLDNPDSALPFNGKVDEVCFFSVGLTQAEVQSLSDGTRPLNCLGHSRAASLVVHLRMGDSDAYPTLTDSKGTQNGTATNMTSGVVNFVADVP